MKKSAWIFILLTTIMGACSTSKSSSVASTQQQPAKDSNNQTIVTQSGKVIPISEAKKLITLPQNALVRKKPEKTMEQSFNAAAVRDTL